MDKIFKQPSVMNANAHFSEVPTVSVPRSKFDRSHAYKTTFDAGKLIPFFWDEVLPGSTHSMDATAFARLATPLYPIMDNIFIDVHWFFVPARLTWDNWEKFMGERVNPDDDPNDYSIPQASIVLGDIKPTSALSYFGLPYRAGVTTPITVSALPIRAYQLIWNQWYRDENLQNSISVPLGDGPDDVSDFHDDNSCLNRNKRKDYFAGCLPWPQKGDAVYVPVIGGQAPIVSTSPYAPGVPVDGIGFERWNGSGGGSQEDMNVHTYTHDVRTTRGNTSGLDWIESDDTSGTHPGHVTVRTINNGASPNVTWQTSDIYADLSSSTNVFINDFRLAVAVQQMLERDARGGTRYIELILSQFGVQSDDARLQRPEYLGGSTTSVNINPIAQTAPDAGGTPLATLAAIGTGVSNSGFTKSFTEHGFLMGIASVRADLTYQQGIERGWSRRTRLDHYLPVFAHLGEQAVLNKEIYAQGTSADTETFGYQERWAEYRYKPSRITGLMASEQPTSLDAWHLSQEFGSLPALNSAFIVENPPIDRVIAVPSEPHFICDIWCRYHSTQPMPIYSVPGLERL